MSISTFIGIIEYIEKYRNSILSLIIKVECVKYNIFIIKYLVSKTMKRISPIIRIQIKIILYYCVEKNRFYKSLATVFL